MYTRTGRGAWGARHMLTHHLRPPARSRPRRDGAGRRLGQPRWLRLRSGLRRVQPSTTYLARHLPPISLSAPAPRSPARRRRRRCHPPSRPRRWPPAPQTFGGAGRLVAAPGSLLRRSGSGAQRSPLPSHATLPSLPPSAERWPSGRLKPPADVCPQGCENVSLRGAAPREKFVETKSTKEASTKQCHEQASEGG